MKYHDKCMWGICMMEVGGASLDSMSYVPLHSPACFSIPLMARLTPFLITI